MSHISRDQKPYMTSDYQVGRMKSDNMPGTQIIFNTWGGREGGREGLANAHIKQTEREAKPSDQRDEMTRKTENHKDNKTVLRKT